MKRRRFSAGLPERRSTPIGVAGRGIVAGLAGTLMLSFLSRVLPGMRGLARPDDEGGRRAPMSTLAPALTIPVSPGPEGLAEQFAYKVASGVFGRDLSSHTHAAGRACHFAYGSAWGMLFGLWQASYPVPPVIAGPLYGGVVWVIGPAMLGPAMQLIEQPREVPRDRAVSLAVGHLAYGLTLALAFRASERKAG